MNFGSHHSAALRSHSRASITPMLAVCLAGLALAYAPGPSVPRRAPDVAVTQQQWARATLEMQTRDARGAPDAAAPLGRGWGQACSAATALMAGALVCASTAAPAFAENELAAMADGKFKPELIQPQCFKDSCSKSTAACADNMDCMKGLTCTAKCMGDAECTVGCFARYGNKVLDDVLACTIEDAGCINIAVLPRGADSPTEAPLPPKALVAATPASMAGKWYKVMGWNSNYDCFDCQQNSFTKPAANVLSTEIGSSAADVEVEYRMPRVRADQRPQSFRQTLHETLQFDTEPGSHRTAHTEGKMFGLTFWENWYVIGENTKAEPPFRLVYYNGKTLQNRYEGAFVYARKPELPREALPSIYKLAREAKLEPTDFCVIDNKCFSEPEPGSVQAPLFTPVAQADVPSPQPSEAPPPMGGVRQALNDAIEFLEDPRPPARAIFAKQRQMKEIREFDFNGYRVSERGYRGSQQ